MEFGIASVAAITVVCYLAGVIAKATTLDNKWIPVICGVLGGALGRSPRGERGLKCLKPGQLLPVDGSLPSRGAWIEMVSVWVSVSELPVAPLAGSVD